MSSKLQTDKNQSCYGTFNTEDTNHHQASAAAAPSFWSKLFFPQAIPLMELGNTRQLNEADLFQLDRETHSAVAFQDFLQHYERHNKSVVKTIVAAYGRQFLLGGVCMLVSTGSSVFAPAVLHHMITAFGEPEIDLFDLSLWLGVFFALKLVNAVVMAHSRYDLEVVATRMAVALKALLFRKAMCRSIQSKDDTKVVDISNLFSSDIDNILWAAFDVNMLWVTPIQIIVVVYMLHYVIDVAAFAGLAVITVFMLASFGIAKLSGNEYDNVMKYKDDRMKTTKEMFGAIQIIKLNAWENKFADKIIRLRATELSALKRFIYLTSANTFTLWASPLLVSTVSFAVYSIVMEQGLTAAKVFTAIALFNAIRDPLRDLPSVIQECIQAKISLNRFSDYMSVAELDSKNVVRNDPTQPSDVMVLIDNGAFGWNDTLLLNNINLTVKKGDFVVVHGVVGSGKSSVCSALLVKACGLLPDLKKFPGGDSTEIGQKGINLSGGQKARVCLARACYSDADIFLLDSPLAAVDAVVQSQIFRDCVCNLLADKTVVLVTHSADIIASEVANIKVLVEDGQLKITRQEIRQPRRSFIPDLPVEDPHEKIIDEMTDKNVGRLVDDEERHEGRVSGQVFLRYFNSLGGIKVCVFLLVVQTFWQVFQIGSDLWLSHWTSKIDGSYIQDETVYNMKVYSCLGAGAAFMVLLRSVVIATAGLRASRNLFSSMTTSLLRSPLRFFDTNPIGRIMNRYGDDMSVVDSNIPSIFGAFLGLLFVTVFQLATAVYMMNFLGVLIIPLVWVYVKTTNLYVDPSREMARLWKVSSSPILSHVAESEDGVVVIRSFGEEAVARMINENFVRNDLNRRCWIAEVTTQQWLKLQMQLIGCAVVFLAVWGLVYLRDFLSPGMAALVFVYVLSVDSTLSSLGQEWAWMEIEMVSPERILEYASLPAEEARRTLIVEPDASWPRTSAIQFQNVVFNYKQGGAPVLKGLSFSINNSEKIGIVGRTGAGKSSLTMALFRMNELLAGKIVIDGVDIASMPLRTLRSNLSIIPQSPVLFKGPLRGYMDPFDEYSDVDIWSMLEKVGIKEQVSALENQLMYELTENGENFSVGERQMLCMARALLTRSRIVVMDEATASIDLATEKKLQQVVTREFRAATVLTIAHRLETVLDSDRILVLSDGRVVEFDTPRNLVKDTNGVFYELAKEGGYLDRLHEAPAK